jgi:hypothetical protein
MVGMDQKKRRYQEELKRIKQLSAINKVLKKGDVENAFLNNADKETEISKDTAVERMLDVLEEERSSKKDLALLDSLVTGETSPRASSRRSSGRSKPQRRKMPARRAASKPKKSSKKKR